ncbi:unnamed protein product [Pedinophyceae sp. YPF-701]|nr:unnamed protein product [Pedinophyceae sp. YPF-701]
MHMARVLIAALVALCAASAEAQFDEATRDLLSGMPAFRHPLTDMPPDAEGVKMKWVAPQNPTLDIPQGDVMEILVGMRNDGDEALNVTGMMGSISLGERFDAYIQNFTYQGPNGADESPLVVEVGEEATFKYVTHPDPSLPVRKAGYKIAVSVFYNADGIEYSSTPFNETVQMVEPNRWIDLELVFMWVMIAGVFAGLGYVVAQQFVDTSVGKRVRRS